MMKKDIVKEVAIAMRERYADFIGDKNLVPFNVSKAKKAWLACAEVAIQTYEKLKGE